MTANPLGEPTRGKGGKIGLTRLQEYCDELNAQAWVRITGNPYFIAEKVKPNGTVDYRLAR